MSQAFSIQVNIIPRSLKFKFEAGTSRGVLTEKNNYLVAVRSDVFPGLVGYGEAGPLKGLSLDDLPDFAKRLYEIGMSLEGRVFSTDPEVVLCLIKEYIPAEYPSVRFAVETALLDLLRGGRRIIFPNEFSLNRRAIPINGLVWMGDFEFMKKQVEEKLGAGFGCIKIKIGAIDFESELALLASIRERFSPKEVELRVDANGAFAHDDALERLMRLSKLQLHSIEQPIKPGQWDHMATLCQKSPLPIALDEELIGVWTTEEKENLLDSIRPHYIILKPTLLGGILETREWISLAESRGIGWWMTSALESNIGLNAIAQFTAEYDPTLPQGLGTGQLYHNNIASPLKVTRGTLIYEANNNWDERLSEGII